MLNPVQL